jgi:hypothetical protein
MKALIIIGIATLSFFGNIQINKDTQRTLSYHWFSSALADDDNNREELEHILIEHKREDEKGGSGGGRGGDAPPGGGGNGQGGGQSEEEKAAEEAAERYSECIRQNRASVNRCITRRNSDIEAGHSRCLNNTAIGFGVLVYYGLPVHAVGLAIAGTFTCANVRSYALDNAQTYCEESLDVDAANALCPT